MSNQKIARKELLTAKQLTEFEQLTSTASKVRYLLSAGHSRGDIARYLDIRYQWVRNIEITPLKKSA